MAGVLRDLKRGELTLKDMSVLREGASAREQHKRTHAFVKEYSLNHVVSIAWGLTDSREHLRPFILSVDGKRYVLSWGELDDLDKTGFFRRETDFKSYNLRLLDGKGLTLDTDMNDEATRDVMVRLTNGKNMEAYLDWYEIMRAGRFI